MGNLLLFLDGERVLKFFFDMHFFSGAKCHDFLFSLFFHVLSKIHIFSLFDPVVLVFYKYENLRE